ncbi:GNAT family N-acetyltransferase [Agromyces ramosus]|uniref:GNAT family acetyltransferase n=1 Tax=Agromyces ramosus TaxID=33879 RepID=A0ABU0RAZ6_9MICO|nr:GNAT family N-acetyltransferase [Agromyces ramosus]MDQ0894942.1 putative GNAT family acetyltransferase [Agromyces ramosus]
MSAGDGFRIEYPDAAGYPDGTGFLGEGTVALVDEVTAGAVRDVDRPSADAASEIEVHRRDEDHVYVATIDDRELASIRYDEVDGRVVVLTTTVAPEFRGRGIAADLIADALDDLRERGRRITVRCPVVAAFIAGNPQYADLLDPEHPGR